MIPFGIRPNRRIHRDWAVERPFNGNQGEVWRESTKVSTEGETLRDIFSSLLFYKYWIIFVIFDIAPSQLTILSISNHHLSITWINWAFNRTITIMKISPRKFARQTFKIHFDAIYKQIYSTPLRQESKHILIPTLPLLTRCTSTACETTTTRDNHRLDCSYSFQLCLKRIRNKQTSAAITNHHHHHSIHFLLFYFPPTTLL